MIVPARDVNVAAFAPARPALAAAALSAAVSWWAIAAIASPVVTSDGRWEVAVEAGATPADGERHALRITDRVAGTVARRVEVADRRGARSRVARLIDAAPRRSVIVLLADVPEAWELSYDPAAGPVYEGLVHDYRTREAIPSPGPLPVRRVHLDEPLTDVLFSPDHAHFVGRAAGGALHVVNLHVRRRIETLATGGAPRPDRGASCVRGGRVVFSIPDERRPIVYEFGVADRSVREVAPAGATCGTNASEKQ